MKKVSKILKGIRDLPIPMDKEMMGEKLHELL